MCRIAGVVDYTLHNAKENAMKMRDAMHRGGPDDAGIWQSDVWPLTLAHRRLAIIDLSPAGHQPMHDYEHGLTITYNGELYNYRELKSELVNAGFRFNTQSDTEVILKAFAAWGASAFNRFNGIFAFALVENKTGLLHLVRDHMGIKPLYFAEEDKRLIFASEIRAFKAFHPEWPENPHWRTFFLAFGHLPRPVTTLQGVIPLIPGHCLTYNLKDQTHNVWKYLSDSTPTQITDEQSAIRVIRQELENAVKRQLVSDAPIGLFLSGGIDSSILTLLAKKELGDQLHTSSLIFNDSYLSELPYQRLIIEQTQALHASHAINQQDFETSLDDYLQAMDQPSNDGVNSYFVCKYAREAGLTVALSGLGADELLGGYPSFDRVNYLKKLRQQPASILKAIGMLMGERFKKAVYLSWRHPVGDYLAIRGIFTPAEIGELTGQTTAEVEKQLQSLYLSEPPSKTFDLNYISWLESNFYMKNQLLKDTDIMSMWHALEVRVPFLDREFMQAVASIPQDIRFNSTQKKHLLIKAFPELPRAIWDRPKQGFTLPFERWFRDSQIVRSETGPLKKLYSKFEKGEISWSKLWVGYLGER